MVKITVTVKEFSAMTGIGQNRVREMCYIPDFPAGKEGNKFLIHLEAASEWLKNRAINKQGIDVAAMRRIMS